MHDGVREIPRPQLVLHQGRDIFAEIDMDVLSLQSTFFEEEAERRSFIRRWIKTPRWGK